MTPGLGRVPRFWLFAVAVAWGIGVFSFVTYGLGASLVAGACLVLGMAMGVGFEAQKRAKAGEG